MPRDPKKQKSARRDTPNNKTIGEMLPTTQAVKLCRKAGIKQQQASVAEHVRKKMFPALLERIIKDAIQLKDYSKNKTVQLRHIQKAVQLRYGKKIY